MRESRSSASMQHASAMHRQEARTEVEVVREDNPSGVEIRYQNLTITTREVQKVEDLTTLWSPIVRPFLHCSNQRVQRHTILNGLNGILKPGTMTLLLGNPGSGKSSFLKLLSGRFVERSNTQVRGDFTYNGVSKETLQAKLPQIVTYVSQEDYHFPTLTVQETLEFSRSFTNSPNHSEQLHNAVSSFPIDPVSVLQRLALGNCKNTLVGNRMLRGLSGGECKRLTIAEMECGLRQVIMMDEPSAGLDSAATMDIMRYYSRIAHDHGRTIVVALQQPSPQVFELFDDVMLLNDGEVIYHGPRAEVPRYFAALGLLCLPHRDFADFLLDLCTPEQRKYEVTDIDPRIPFTASEFANAFRKSSQYTHMMRQLNASDRRVSKSSFVALPEFSNSFFANVVTLSKRELLLMVRNSGMLRGKCLMTALVGLLNSTAFDASNPTQIQISLGIYFAVIMFLALTHIPLIPVHMRSRQVYYRQRRSNFYQTGAYVFSVILAQIPVGILESVSFASLIYWICGMVREATTFALYLIILILTHIAFSTLFTFLSSATPNPSIAKPLAMVMIMFLVLFAGFIVSRGSIPFYLIWIYWLNPIAWSVRALAVLQYRSAHHDICVFKNIDYCKQYGMTLGQYYLSVAEVPSSRYWIYYTMVFLVVFATFNIFLTYLALRFCQFETFHKAKKAQQNGDGCLDYGDIQTPSNELSSKCASSHNDCVVNVSYSEIFTPVTLAFRNLRYSVNDPKSSKKKIDLLLGISGYAMPGTMTALMGSSGAGKTTLLDVIAGRKTRGTISGEILLNGCQVANHVIHRVTGYCEQMDIHFETSTFREALTFSAFLRQSSDVPDEMKRDSVEECLLLLGMESIADRVIHGSSVEQKKRLTIGVELAAQPSVLFLDEPTSGLDACAAKLIMDGVRRVANTKRTVVCTIHQPSYKVLSLFDNLLLLKRGGETVYFGALGNECGELVRHFEAINGVKKLPPGYNPATWMLECIGAGTTTSDTPSIDFVDIFKQSESKQLLEQTLSVAGIGRPMDSSNGFDLKHKRAASSLVQLRFVVGRFIEMYFRTPAYNLTRLVITTLLAMTFAAVFSTFELDTFQQINSGIGVVFISTFFLGIVAFNGVLPFASSQLPPFYKERSSQTYNALWYFVGSTVAELPYVLCSSLIYTAIFSPAIGFSTYGDIVTYWLAITLHLLISTYMGQFVAYTMPTVELAALTGTLVNTICFLFLGFNPPAHEIPRIYQWFYVLTPHRYPLAAIGALIFAKCEMPTDIGCSKLVGAPLNMDHMTTKEYAETIFNLRHDEITRNLSISIVLIFLFRLFAALVLRYLNHQKR
uniref:ATPbinding Cassette (ABC) Superfamily putative n=1 Tax=Albugo laibachii Nc14 TaxID=890382 RepID=F0WKD3_9STRA|nr:ATPbinding Cassette (ABC) Superfamily putative [Albugo laibachii Nc14]|eukprot:CCA21737.1 ATPbinding Cassette (ABC) Superfamily putative [Albugo laibachii Nc14]